MWNHMTFMYSSQNSYSCIKLIKLYQYADRLREEKMLGEERLLKKGVTELFLMK